MPFWFWNDDMDPDEIRRQIREMADRGIGGFFIHARMGRVTPYMSESWFECVKAAIDEARGHGMQAWIYDEDNWPSGYAGGAICDLGDRYLQKYVFCHEILLEHHGDVIELPQGDGLLSAFSANRERGAYRDIQRIPPERLVDGTVLKEHVHGDALLVCTTALHKIRRYFCPECSVVGYVDVMDPEVIRAFIDHTYEAYKRELGDDFGKTVPGFFLDEPNYHEYEWRRRDLRRPWTAALPDVYYSFTGRDLRNDLPLLFFNWGEFKKARLGYYRSVTKLFVESFTHQLYDWCEKNGVKLTGHYIVEEDLRGSCQCTGNAMEHYQFEHVPGIDHLGKDIDLTDDFWSASRVLCKQVATVARQLGKDRVMCETFAGGGWDFGPREEKWMADWMQALGVNMICPHAFHYSLRGYRKRDYPPSLTFQQPWWPFSTDLGKHFARLGWILTRGERVAEVAVLHPMDSVRVTHRVQDFPWEPDPIQDPFQKVTEILLSNQIDFDYLDESILREHGRAEGKTLFCGAGEYRVVVVPPLVTISPSTVEMLERFVKRGGTVLVAEPRAEMVDGEPDESLDALWARCRELEPWGEEDFEKRLLAGIDKAIKRDVRVETGNRMSREIVYMHRRTEEGDVYFFASAAKTPFEAEVTLVGHRGAGPEHWDTITGAREPISGKQRRQGAVFTLPFDYGRSHVIFVPKEGDKIAPPTRRRKPKRTKIAAEGKGISVTVEDPNVFLLDRCRAKVGDRGFSDPMPVLFTNEHFRHAAGEEPSVDGTLEFRFRSGVALGSGIEILVETPDAFRFEMNGRPIRRRTDRGWYRDTSLRRLVLTGGIAEGENTLHVTFRWKEGLELEPFYLLGKFSLADDGNRGYEIRRPVKRLELGSWAMQGLPFYAGEVTYRFQRSLRKVPSEDARILFESFRSALRVRVNGEDAGTLLWPPYELRVGHLLREGKNAFEVTVANSLRNFYGPHHLPREDDIDCLGPHNFFEKKGLTQDYLLKPAGLLGEVYLEDPVSGS